MWRVGNYLALKCLNNHTACDAYLLAKFVCLSGIVGHAAQFVPQKVPIFGTPSDGIYTWEALKQLAKNIFSTDKSRNYKSYVKGSARK